MFVRVKRIGAYEYHRHVQALRRRDEVSGMLDALVASAARHSRRSIVLSSGRLWREIGCGETINALLDGRRFGFDVERAIYLTVLHRLMVSGSDRHASRWHHGFRIPGAAELTLDHAYRAMAWLGEDMAEGRTTTDAIEEDLYRRRQQLFGEVSIAFFDTTSLYFEGAGGQTLGQRGLAMGPELAIADGAPGFWQAIEEVWPATQRVDVVDKVALNARLARSYLVELLDRARIA